MISRTFAILAVLSLLSINVYCGDFGWSDMGSIKCDFSQITDAAGTDLEDDAKEALQSVESDFEFTDTAGVWQIKNGDGQNVLITVDDCEITWFVNMKTSNNNYSVSFGIDSNFFSSINDSGSNTIITSLSINCTIDDTYASELDSKGYITQTLDNCKLISNNTLYCNASLTTNPANNPCNGLEEATVKSLDMGAKADSPGIQMEIYLQSSRRLVI